MTDRVTLECSMCLHVEEYELTDTPTAPPCSNCGHVGNRKMSKRYPFGTLNPPVADASSNRVDDLRTEKISGGYAVRHENWQGDAIPNREAEVAGDPDAVAVGTNSPGSIPRFPGHATRNRVAETAERILGLNGTAEDVWQMLASHPEMRKSWLEWLIKEAT